MEGWVGLGGWLHTEIIVRHRELNPDTVTHLSTNRARPSGLYNDFAAIKQHSLRAAVVSITGGKLFFYTAFV